MRRHGAALALVGLGLVAGLGPGPSAAQGPTGPLDWGGRYERAAVPTTEGSALIHTLTVPTHRVAVRPALAQGALGRRAPLVRIAPSHRALAAINANFFDPATSLPVGFLLRAGRALATPEPRRGTLSVGVFGRLRIANPRIALRAEVGRDARSVALDGLNRPLRPHEVIAYTPEYSGPWAPVVRRASRTVLVRDGEVRWVGTRLRAPTSGERLLVASGKAVSRLADVLPAEPLELGFAMTPAQPLARHAVQAGPTLIRNRRLVRIDEDFGASFRTRQTARSAVARLSQNRLMLAVAEQSSRSSGLSLATLARALRARGAEAALALDGGGSSGLVFRQGARWRRVGGGRDVPVALTLVSPRR